jgi:putative protein kinase ArgK-like GTPase of G3E family
VPRREPEDTEVIGRDAELVIADASLERLQAGVGGLLLVEGEAGIGKSALLDTIGARARRRGLTVVAVAPSRTSPRSRWRSRIACCTA